MATEVFPNVFQPTDQRFDFEGSANRYGIHFTEQAAYLSAKADAMASLQPWAETYAINNRCVLLSVEANDTPLPPNYNDGHGRGWTATLSFPEVSYCHTHEQPIVFVIGKNTPLTAAHAYAGYPFSQEFIDRFNTKCGETCSVKDDLPSFGPPDPVPLNMTNISPLARSAADCLLSGLGIVNIGGVGDSQVFSSGFRTKEYQQHLSDLWRKWRDELEKILILSVRN